MKKIKYDWSKEAVIAALGKIQSESKYPENTEYADRSNEWKQHFWSLMLLSSAGFAPFEMNCPVENVVFDGVKFTRPIYEKDFDGVLIGSEQYSNDILLKV